MRTRGSATRKPDPGFANGDNAYLGGLWGLSTAVWRFIKRRRRCRDATRSLDIISTFSIQISAIPSPRDGGPPTHLRLDGASVSNHNHRGLRRRGAQQWLGQELAGTAVWLFWCDGSENRVNGSHPVLLSNLKLTNCIIAMNRQTSAPARIPCCGSWRRPARYLEGLRWGATAAKAENQEGHGHGCCGRVWCWKWIKR